MGELVLTEKEIGWNVFVNAKNIPQPILSKLRERGAPVSGVTWLELDQNYNWFRYIDLDSDKMTLKWRPKVDGNAA